MNNGRTHHDRCWQDHLGCAALRIVRLERELAGGLANASGSDSRDVKLQADLRAAKEANYQSRMQSLAENIARLEASLRTNRADQRAQQERVKVATDLEQMQKDLVTQNFGAKKQLLEARDRRQEVAAPPLVRHICQLIEQQL